MEQERIIMAAKKTATVPAPKKGTNSKKEKKRSLFSTRRGKK